jgi:hypothetical protein
MKPKPTSLVLSFATAKPPNSQQMELVNNAPPVNTRSPKVQAKRSIAPVNNRQFSSTKQDLVASYTPQQTADWNRLGVLTKPYRS